MDTVSEEPKEMLQRMLVTIRTNKFYSESFFNSYDISKEEIVDERRRLDDFYAFSSSVLKKMANDILKFHL